jgi:hypothetical protein
MWTHCKRKWECLGKNYDEQARLVKENERQHENNGNYKKGKKL